MENINHSCGLNDIQDLLVEALRVLQNELRSENRQDRVYAAQQILSFPIGMAFNQMEQQKEPFFIELPDE